MIKRKHTFSTGEMFGFLGAFTLMSIFLFSLAMCLPALFLWGLLYLALPAFGVSYYVTFFQCWLFCMIAKIVGGLFFGQKTSNN